MPTTTKRTRVSARKEDAGLDQEAAAWKHGGTAETRFCRRNVSSRHVSLSNPFGSSDRIVFCLPTFFCCLTVSTRKTDRSPRLMWSFTMVEVCCEVGGWVGWLKLERVCERGVKVRVWARTPTFERKPSVCWTKIAPFLVKYLKHDFLPHLIHIFKVHTKIALLMCPFFCGLLYKMSVAPRNVAGCYIYYINR